jgi:hypothetical protein
MCRHGTHKVIAGHLQVGKARQRCHAGGDGARQLIAADIPMGHCGEREGGGEERASSVGHCGGVGHRAYSGKEGIVVAAREAIACRLQVGKARQRCHAWRDGA